MMKNLIANSSQINVKKIHKIILDNFADLAPIYYKMLSEWMNNSYEKFQDIDKYMIMLYLMNVDLSNYLRNEQVEGYELFFLYDKSLELDEINIIEISKNLNIPKESARRKILRLEGLGIIKKIGKKIFVDRSSFKLLLPKETLQNLSVLTSKIIEICKKEKIVNKLIRSDEVSKHIRSNFTHCWSYFYDFIVIFTSRWKNQLGDLEVFSVGMVITLHSIVSKTFERNGLNFSNWQKNKVNIDEIGVNAMSISQITNIPRPTVIRKLNYLLKNKYISINKKKLYNLNLQDRTLKITTKIQDKNILSFSELIFNIFQQINIR